MAASSASFGRGLREWTFPPPFARGKQSGNLRRESLAEPVDRRCGFAAGETVYRNQHPQVCRDHAAVAVGLAWPGCDSINRTNNSMKLLLTLLTTLLLSPLLVPLAASYAAEVRDLRCEYRTNPLGIDVEKPRLSWVIESGRRGERETAYQVLVASTPKLLAQDKGDLWDSGRVSSDQSVYVEYAGRPLESRMSCHWKVRIWDQDGKVTGWSQPATWTMGLLKPADWQAKWITASKWFMPPGVRPRGLVVSVGGWADVDLGESFPIDSIKLYFLIPMPRRSGSRFWVRMRCNFPIRKFSWISRRRIINRREQGHRCLRLMGPSSATSGFGLPAHPPRTMGLRIR